MSLFGTLVSLATVAPAALAGRLVRLARWSAALALSTGLAWLMVQTALIAETNSVVDTLYALPIVALHTQFGRFMLVRFALLTTALPLIGARRPGLLIAIALTGTALGLQAAMGHVGAIGGGAGAALLGSELMHLLAAGACLAELLPLLIMLNALPQQAAMAAFRGFSAVGLPAVLVLAGTAVVEASAFVGGLPGLLGTAYGRVALIKLVLFLVLLALAALTDFAVTARRHMRFSVTMEMAIGAIVVTAAASRLLISRYPPLRNEFNSNGCAAFHY